MEKIYGYKQDDVELLAEYLKNRRGGSLSKAFSEYGALHNKAKGTVRNLYYALAKKSVEDEQFCNKYFDGVPIKVSKIVEFDLDEDDAKEEEDDGLPMFMRRLFENKAQKCADDGGSAHAHSGE